LAVASDLIYNSLSLEGANDMRTEFKLLSAAILSSLMTTSYAAPAATTTVVSTQTTTVPAGTPASTTSTPAAAPKTVIITTTTKTPAVNADGSVPMQAPTATTEAIPTPVAVRDPDTIKPSTEHGYVLAQGSINQPYGANPYRTLSVTVSPCDTGFSPYVSMAIGGIAGWNSHTVAEAWAVPTSAIKRDGGTYTVNYRAESRFYNGNWAWSSNVYVTWTLYCIPTDSFTYTPH
jgi:hypothetical protein